MITAMESHEYDIVEMTIAPPVKTVVVRCEQQCWVPGVSWVYTACVHEMLEWGVDMGSLLYTT